MGVLFGCSSGGCQGWLYNLDVIFMWSRQEVSTTFTSFAILTGDFFFKTKQIVSFLQLILCQIKGQESEGIIIDRIVRKALMKR